MPPPTTSIIFSGSTPSAPSGDQDATPQSDGGAPFQKVSFVPKRATSSLYGTVLEPSGGFVTPSEIQEESFVYAEDTGSANAYAIALSPAPSIVAGSEIVFNAANANTGPSTLAVNGGSAINIYKQVSTPLTSGDILAGQIVRVVYDGTYWQIAATGSIPAGTALPILRGSGITSSASAASLTLSLPSGTQAGDLAIIFANSGYAPSVPSGWTNLSIASFLTWLAIGAYKILTTGDITTGSVTVSFGGSYDCVLAIAVFIGPTGGIRETESGDNSGTSFTITNITSSAVLNTDAAIYFASGRQSGVSFTITPSSGSANSLRTASTTNASSELADQAMSGGVLSVANAFSGAGAGGTAVQVIVKGVPLGDVVTSLNGLTGALGLTSTGSTVTITEVGNTVNLEASGGGSSPLTTKGDLYTYGATNARLAVGTDGYKLTARSSATDGIDWEASVGIIGITIDGGGSPPATGLKGLIQIPFGCTITGWSLIADQAGSASIDIWALSGSASPTAPSIPTSGNIISASAPAALSSSPSSQSAAGGSSAISTWTKTLTQWMTVGFNLSSVTTCTRLTLELQVTRT